MTCLASACALACAAGAGGEGSATTTTSTSWHATSAGSDASDPTEAGSSESTGGSTGASTGGPAAGVDLACEGLSWEPPAPTQGQAVTLRASARNHGTAPLPGPVRVAFFADGIEVASGSLAALAPGEVTEVAATMSWPAPGPGEVKIKGVVDADNVIAEADEADNVRTATLTVAAPAGACRALGAWASSEPFADDAHGSHPLPSFASHGSYFVHTKTLEGAEDRVLYAARPQPDGALGPWQVAWSDHGGGPHGYTAIDIEGAPSHFRNGHIVRYVIDDQGAVQGLEDLEENVDATFGGNRYVWDSAVYAALPSGPRWVIHLGGFSFTGYMYRPNVYRSGVPLGPTFAGAGLDHPAERPGRAAFVGLVDDGVIITGVSGGASLWQSRLAADGSLTPWAPLPDLPPGTGNERGELIAAGRTLLAIRGSKVFRADVADAGALSPWVEQPSLPEDQVDVSWGDGHLEGAAHGIIGDFVYVTGSKRVHFAALSPSPCAG